MANPKGITANTKVIMANPKGITPNTKGIMANTKGITFVLRVGSDVMGSYFFVFAFCFRRGI